MKKIAILGNCQNSPLARLLSAMCPDMQFLAPTAVHRIEASGVAKFLSSLDTFDAVVTQPIARGYRNNIGIDTDNLRSLLRADQRLILIPNLYFEGFCPTWGYMKYKGVNLRGKMPSGIMPSDASEGIFGTLRKADYQDFFLLCAWFKGFSINQTATLLETSFDCEVIRSWFTDSLAEFASRERFCDTNMFSVVQNILTHSQYQFHSFNHPNKALLTTLALQILAIIFNIEVQEIENLRSCADSLRDWLEDIQLPIYQFVSSSLGIKSKEKVTLKIYDSVFSVSEFVEHYYAYFNCLGKEGLFVNCDHIKFKLCEKLISSMITIKEKS